MAAALLSACGGGNAPASAAAQPQRAAALSAVAEVDPVQAYTDLATTKSTYERSIQVTAQILSLSAFNH